MSLGPFRFRDAVRLTAPTGVAAATLREFRAVVESAAPGVLHHHLRETPLRFTFALFSYPNDFAHWAAAALENLALAERLAALDPFHERDLEVLRERVLDMVDDAYAESPGASSVRPGQEFHFSSSVSVEIDLGIEARDVGELVAGLREVPATSLYFHLFEARVRNPDGADDFSRWLDSAGLTEPAQRLRDLDIYLASLELCRTLAVERLEGTAP